MAAALLSATGSTQNLLTSNPGMKLSGLYHMCASLLTLLQNEVDKTDSSLARPDVTGNQGLFNYGDAGPNKFVATANGLMFYGQQYGSFAPFRCIPSSSTRD
jgi:hypothetical protein